MRSYSGWYVLDPGLISGHSPSLIHHHSLTCKGRKLKCDENKPSCGNCVKASRGCVYGESSIFRSQEIGLTPGRKRRKRNRREKESTAITEDHTWVEVPAERKSHVSRLNGFQSTYMRQSLLSELKIPGRLTARGIYRTARPLRIRKNCIKIEEQTLSEKTVFPVAMKPQIVFLSSIRPFTMRRS
jgi:hypothetical protein